MVDHTGYRLVPHLANLGKGIAFIKMQPEGLPLFGGQALDQFPPTNPPEQPLARPVVSGRHWCCDVAGFQLVKFHRPIVRAGAEVNPSAQRLVVTRLHDPAARRFFRRVVQVRLPKKVQEEFLHKILGFGGVMENSLADAEDHLSIPAEQKTKGLLIVGTDPGKKGFVGELLGRRNRVPIYLIGSLSVLAERKCGKTSSGEPTSETWGGRSPALTPFSIIFQLWLNSLVLSAANSAC